VPVPVLRTGSHRMVLNINQGRLIPV
jgi:hypothetical protein